MEEYLAACPEATMAEIVEKFGEPEEFAQAYMNMLDNGELQKKLAVSRFAKRVLLVTALAVIAAVVVAMVVLIVRNDSSRAVSYSEGTTSTSEGTLSTVVGLSTRRATLS